MVAMEIEAAAVIRVATRARHDIDGAVARQAAARIEVHRGNLKFLDDILGNLKENANRAGRADAGAIHRHPGRSDARNRLQAAAERRDEHATVGQPRRIGHTWLQLRQLEEVAAVERQPFDLLPRDDTTHLMVVAPNQRLRRGYRDRLGHLAELQHQVDGGRRPRLDARLALQPLERRRLRPQSDRRLEATRPRCRHHRPMW